MNATTVRKGPREAKQASDRMDADGGRPPDAASADRRRKPERPRVGWIATTAILMMLLVGAGWELWRWLLLVITMN